MIYILKMKTIHLIFLYLTFSALQLSAQDIPTLDWDALQETKPWEATELYDPAPPKVTPSLFHSPPSDAIVLFDGEDLEAWHKPQYTYEGANMEILKAMIAKDDDEYKHPAADWIVKDGVFIVKQGSGAIETKEAFGSMQLHLEFLSPYDPGKEGQAYSNSGVFLMGLYEIQILNNYENTTYSNGQVGSVYKQHIPLVNASRPPGEWQSYDIIFNAPVFSRYGKLKSPATVTVIHNGVLIQNHVELRGPTVYIGQPNYTPHAAELPLRLQDHGDAVRYRNIWVRRL